MKNHQYFISLLRYILIPGLLLVSQSVTAQQDAYINYQGILKLASGEPAADGDYDFTFSFWSSATGTANSDKLLKIGATDPNVPANQWSETITLSVAGGVFSHNLGTVTPMNPKNFTGPVYLNIRVGSKDLVPRTEFSYSPYSFFVYNTRTVVCSGAVGDVKYSILPPDKFKEANGDCWVPLDGRTLSSSDVLRQTYGVTTLPNAGGQFIRTQDFTAVAGTEYWKPKNSSNLDPGRDSSTPVGTLQNGSLTTHTHTIATAGNHRHSYERRGASTANNGNTGDHTVSSNDNGTSGQVTTSTSGAHGHNINSAGSETRPVNTNFWIYIRINN
ncbi:MAG: hypothetical protein ACK5Q2_16410 [Bacteroidota bacterium]